MVKSWEMNAKDQFTKHSYRKNKGAAVRENHKSANGIWHFASSDTSRKLIGLDTLGHKGWTVLNPYNTPDRLLFLGVQLRHRSCEYRILQRKRTRKSTISVGVFPQIRLMFSHIFDWCWHLVTGLVVPLHAWVSVLNRQKSETITESFMPSVDLRLHAVHFFVYILPSSSYPILLFLRFWIQWYRECSQHFDNHD
jgi:hypothetical protein